MKNTDIWGLNSLNQVFTSYKKGMTGDGLGLNMEHPEFNWFIIFHFTVANLVCKPFPDSPFHTVSSLVESLFTCFMVKSC